MNHRTLIIAAELLLGSVAVLPLATPAYADGTKVAPSCDDPSMVRELTDKLANGIANQIMDQMLINPLKKTFQVRHGVTPDVQIDATAFAAVLERGIAITSLSTRDKNNPDGLINCEAGTKTTINADEFVAAVGEALRTLTIYGQPMPENLIQMALAQVKSEPQPQKVINADVAHLGCTVPDNHPSPATAKMMFNGEIVDKGDEVDVVLHRGLAEGQVMQFFRSQQACFNEYARVSNECAATAEKLDPYR
jgi:hypothetical protein